MASNPCKICDSTDLHLVDGFYYCVECGTQDANARETVVEQTLLTDGTFAHTTKKKYKTFLQDSIEMSGEWHKWHAYNFILSGLTDELIALGAEASVKTTVLWVWIRYIKKFQVKDNKENNNNFDSDSVNESKIFHEDSNNDLNDINTESYKTSKIKTEKFRWDINIVTKGTLLTILYIALNLDRSDIQLSHLLRFVREGRLSLFTCLKYVPQELSTKNIPHWVSFIKCQNEYSSKVIRTLALTFFKRLDLGYPLVPNLNMIINNYVKELCLPEDFKDLVLSLMNLIPCDYLSLKSKSQKRIVRIPDYEGICMSYILVGLKLCFGLDGNYELKLSDRVDKINYEKNHLKSYKLGMYSEPSERLLSFREWCTFLQFRKTILCKYYLPIARQLHMPVDDAVLMDHLEKRNTQKPKLSDEVTMDILNKISAVEDKVTIPRKKFVASLTPMTAYTDIIQDYIQDPDFRLLMCEDFSQYSLKYATKDLKLPGFLKSIKGVSKKNKILNPRVSGTLQASKGDTIMIFVRNCDNKNWLKTKPPKIEHVTKLINNKNGSENSDPGYDSTVDELTAVESELEKKENEEISKETVEDLKEFETVENEDIDKSIFDDDFLDMEKENDNINDIKSEDNENIFEFNYNEVQNQQDSKIDIQDSINDQSSASENIFDPETFDRNKVIKELIEIACKKYKIAKPRDKVTREPRKRKMDMVNNEVGVCEPKKRNTVDKEQRDAARAATKELLATYYKNIENDLLVQVSEHFKSILQNTADPNELNSEIVNEPADFNETFVQAENNTEGITDKEQNESVISSIHPNHTLNDTLNEEEEDLNPKDDPDFDAKTHDINQLYIKINEDDSINYLDELLNIENDPDIEKIIEKKIYENTHGNKQTDNITDITQNLSDSDVTSKPQVEEIFIEKKKKMKPKLDPLITNTDITKFNYWTRHYKALPFIRSLDMNQKFDVELLENCPKSFVFIISECAAILDCTTFCLYKSMQNLEATMLSHNY